MLQCKQVTTFSVITEETRGVSNPRMHSFEFQAIHSTFSTTNTGCDSVSWELFVSHFTEKETSTGWGGG